MTLHKFLNEYRHWLALSVWAVGILGVAAIVMAVAVSSGIPGGLGMWAANLLLVHGALCTIIVIILRKAEDYADKN